MVVEIIGQNALGGIQIRVNGVVQTVPPTYAALTGTPYYIKPTDISGSTLQTQKALEIPIGSLTVGAYTGSGQTAISVANSSVPIIIPTELPAGSEILVSTIDKIQQAKLSEEQVKEINKQLENPLASLNETIRIPLDGIGIETNAMELAVLGFLALTLLK